MKPLTIERVKDQKDVLTFLGWKDDGLAFYATASDGRPAVIEPVSAYPDEINAGEPYRFPRMVPLEIVPKRFELSWTARHREVLRRWRDAKCAEVDALPVEELFVWDKVKNPRPLRSPEEILRKKQEEKERWERHYQVLTDTPLAELWADTPAALDELCRGKWRDEMGNKFRAMIREANSFAYSYLRALDCSGQITMDQGMLDALLGVRFVMRGDDKRDYPLTDVDVRRPTDQEAQAYSVMRQLVKSANKSAEVGQTHGRVLAKLDSMVKKTDEVLSGVQTLTELAGEQAAARDKWRENPLGSREAVADYLLTMDAMKIERRIATALVRFGYGNSREQCAETANVSVATIKRALAKARKTDYANFFARSRAQKIKARGAMKKPDELYARLMQLAAKDPDELRAMTEQMIAKAQGESDGGNAWDKTVQGLP